MDYYLSIKLSRLSCILILIVVLLHSTIGGGVDNSLSLLELFAMLENKLNIKMNYTQLHWRESDQKVFVADIQKTKEIIGWEPKVSAEEGIGRMLYWLSYE